MIAELTDKFADACEALGLKTEPSVRFHKGVLPDSPLTRGHYQGVGTFHHHIDVFLGAYPEATTLTSLSRDVSRTILHELRHAWQDENWGVKAFSDKPGAYWTTRHEEDARDWADKNIHRFQVCRLRRPAMRSRLSRLSAAEGRVRAA